MSNIPSDFTRTTTEVHGKVGAEWLAHLPDLLADCARRWSLTLGSPFAPLTYNYVAPAVRADGTRAVLKVGVPCDEFSSEIAALRVFAGRGSVRLLEADSEAGALLLERLEPGTSLVSILDDDEATGIAAGVMKRLWQPAPAGHEFPTVARWAEGLGNLRARFDGGTGPLPARRAEEAEALFTELLESASAPMLLHGDLHHGNILDAGGDTWRAIDPKGVVGEPAFEPSAFLLNPTLQSSSILSRRLDIFAETLALPRERILGWGMARAVLSACWTLEDHGTGWEGGIVTAERLSALGAGRRKKTVHP